MQIAPITITLADLSASITLNPIQSSPNAIYRGAGLSLPATGNSSAQILPTMDKGNGLSKVRVVFQQPVMETVSPGDSAGYVAEPKVAFTLKGDVTFFLPSRSTAVQRQHVLEYLGSLLINPQVVDSIVALAPPY